MGSVLTVTVILVLPFVAGTALGLLPMPGAFRVTVIGSFPIALIVWVRTSTHSLSDSITLTAVVEILIGGWLMGFAAARLIRRFRARAHN
jgi:hypothetical protein